MTTLLKAAVIELPRFIGFINSVAYARAASLCTTLTYEKFSSNSVMNFLLQATTAEPGFPEVTQDPRQIEVHRKRVAATLLDDALEAAAAGGQRFTAMLTQLESSKQRDLANVQRVFDQAREIGDHIENRLTFAIRTLATVKAASSIMIAVTPVGAAAFGGSAALVASSGTIALVYSVGKAVAKNAAEGSDAGVIAFEVGKEIGKEGIQKGAEKVEHAAAKSITTHAGLMDDALRKIDVLSRRLARQLPTGKSAQLERRLGRATQSLQMSTKAMQNAGKLRFAAKGVPVVFAALDVWEAIGDWRTETR